MLTKASIEKLNSLLALPATGGEQDWDVELADSGRLDEFVAAYSNVELTAADRIALMALILASVDSYLDQRHALPTAWSSVSELLHRDEELHRQTTEYWRREGEEDPEGWFQLTPHIRQLNRQ